MKCLDFPVQMKANRSSRPLWDDEFDLMQNNGRVTLPGASPDGFAIRKHLPIFILIGATLLAALLAVPEMRNRVPGPKGTAVE
jgi:hypothetical protein